MADPPSLQVCKEKEKNFISRVFKGWFFSVSEIVFTSFIMIQRGGNIQAGKVRPVFACALRTGGKHEHGSYPGGRVAGANRGCLQQRAASGCGPTPAFGQIPSPLAPTGSLSTAAGRP